MAAHFGLCPPPRLQKQSTCHYIVIHHIKIRHVSLGVQIIWWPPYWPTGRLADNQKMRNLTDNLSNMSNKTYSEAVIGQFKTLFRKRTIIPQFFHQLQRNEGLSVVEPYFTASGHASRAMAMPQRPAGLDMKLSQPNY